MLTTVARVPDLLAEKFYVCNIQNIQCTNVLDKSSPVPPNPLERLELQRHKLGCDEALLPDLSD